MLKSPVTVSKNDSHVNIIMYGVVYQFPEGSGLASSRML